jgi:adenine-specific DNA-methyltransferase
MAEIQKQELTSMDIKEAQLQKLKALFPEAFTEGLKVDWDKLRLTLGDETVDTGKERYGMNWPGKADCFKTIQQPSIATLVPAREESIDFDTTQNLFIEGDNLEVLKLLQKSYLGKIKMIYIDPPYNTGNDFIYPDNYNENLDTYLEYTGQIDGEGKKFATNAETDGRFHSKWMNMMYPRLFLAKNLLKEDGVIFISIDDNEVTNLVALCNEIFGEENLISQIIWHNSSRPDDYIATEHEYILAFAKNKSLLSPWKRAREESALIKSEIQRMKNINLSIHEAQAKLKDIIESYQKKDKKDKTRYYSWLVNYSNIDDDWMIYYPVDLTGEGQGPARKFGDKLIDAPAGRHWMGQDYIDQLYKENRIVWRNDRAYRKLYIDESLDNLKSIINIPTRGGSELLKQLLGKDVFDKPKPHSLIKHISQYILSDSDIIFDFFAGSATTAHAIMELNKEDYGSRRFICVQIPEPTEEKSEAFKAGYKTISDISKERIRRTIKNIKDEQLKIGIDLFVTKKENYKLDLGFKVYKLAQSNFKVWNTALEKSPEVIQQKLFDHIQHISPEAQQEAILYELLLKSGFELTTPIETLILAGKKVFSIAGRQLLICLEKDLTHDCIRAMAENEPARVICLDEAFTGTNADALKTNAVQIMKSKGVVNFRTV